MISKNNCIPIKYIKKLLNVSRYSVVPMYYLIVYVNIHIINEFRLRIKDSIVNFIFMSCALFANKHKFSSFVFMCV